jgi:hypothetical protein
MAVKTPDQFRQQRVGRLLKRRLPLGGHLAARDHPDICFLAHSWLRLLQRPAKIHTETT